MLMALRDLFAKAPEPQTMTVDAAATPAPFNNSVQNYFYPLASANRQQAMAVPTIARARNIICSTVASLPLEQRIKSSGVRVEPNRVINQPDSRVPGSSIYAYIAEDLLFHGVAYGQVLSMYADGRIQEWTRVSPDRVTYNTNANQTEIIGYMVDGVAVPSMGVSSLVVFNGLDEGFLSRAGRTIRAAVALENASEAFAKEPVPMMVLKSNGTNLTSERIGKLLEAWRVARTTRSTAFLNADVELQAMGIDPNKLQLNEARQYVALELCRAAGLPAYFASAETTSMTYSNAISERRSLVDFSLRPILTAIEQRLSLADFVGQGNEVRYALDDFLRGNPLERAQVYEILNRIGAMSVDEIRQQEDLLS
jgi:HK97 family phage portal protein